MFMVIVEILKYLSWHLVLKRKCWLPKKKALFCVPYVYLFKNCSIVNPSPRPRAHYKFSHSKTSLIKGTLQVNMCCRKVIDLAGKRLLWQCYWEQSFFIKQEIEANIGHFRRLYWDILVLAQLFHELSNVCWQASIWCIVHRDYSTQGLKEKLRRDRTVCWLSTNSLFLVVACVFVQRPHQYKRISRKVRMNEMTHSTILYATASPSSRTPEDHLLSSDKNRCSFFDSLHLVRWSKWETQ